LCSAEDNAAAEMSADTKKEEREELRSCELVAKISWCVLWVNGELSLPKIAKKLPGNQWF
jgi:hypothetical protein|tara:strand:+ start:1071 stop:1250 length:180 start_codon:yes stop_codon:yes gene_type:complete